MSRKYKTTEAIRINIQQYHKTISSISLFSIYSEDQLATLLPSLNIEISEYAKGQIIHLENEICQTMDIILAGLVSVQKIDQDGNTLLINVFGAKDILGANLIFSSRNYYPMTVTAASKTTLLHMPKALILEICQKDINFMVNLLKVISDTTSILVNKIDTLSFKTIRKCIIDFLKYEYNIQKSKVIKLNTSKKDLADKFGVQRSSLSRELNKMRREGFLDFNAATITIMDLSIILND